MGIVVRLSPASSVTAEQYDKSWEALEKAKLEWPPAGLDYHVCFFGPDGNVLVSQVWDTQEQFEAFGERLIPVLAEAGIEFPAPPEIFEAHDIRKPSKRRE